MFIFHLHCFWITMSISHLHSLEMKKNIKHFFANQYNPDFLPFWKIGWRLRTCLIWIFLHLDFVLLFGVTLVIENSHINMWVLTMYCFMIVIIICFRIEKRNSFKFFFSGYLTYKFIKLRNIYFCKVQLCICPAFMQIGPWYIYF